MTIRGLARRLFSQHGKVLLDHLDPHNCKHEQIVSEVGHLVALSDGSLRREQIGSSLEGRSINLIRWGEGKTKVLLWSQMHGDESTATLALMDVFNFLIQGRSEQRRVNEMFGRLTLCFIPMLNPDGAERRQRRTAQGIDMNRDARLLMTPEAKVLWSVQQRLKPEFGFNLHDQELSSVGQTPNVVAIALLAPARDATKSVDRVRQRAMRVAATIAQALDPFIGGHLATYDDAFESRAFGDTMQALGTSTVLIESGHWPADPRKRFIRKLNFVGILTALIAIGDGSYRRANLDSYRDMPPNGKCIYDLIIRNLKLEHSSGWSQRVDVGLAVELKNNKTLDAPVVTVKDVGDLGTLGALEEIDGNGVSVLDTSLILDEVVPLRELRMRLNLQRPEPVS